MINASKLENANSAVEIAARERIAEARKLNLGQRIIELIEQWADETKRALAQATVCYEEAVPTTLSECRRPAFLGKIVRIRQCYIREFEDPKILETPRVQATLRDVLAQDISGPPTEVVTTMVSRLKLSSPDLIGKPVKTEPFVDRPMIERIQSQSATYATWEGLFFVTSGPCEADGEDEIDEADGVLSRFALFVLDARPMEAPTQLLGPTPGEIERALELYGNDPDPMATALRVVVRAVGITGLERLPLQTEVLRVQVLAAASNDKRIHTLQIGPPAVGKSLAYKAAKVLQPVARSAQPTRITEAGLFGAGTSSRERRDPGLVPQAHLGVFSIEDFHQANGVKNQRVCSALAQVMAEGEMHDSSVTRMTYRTQVSVVMDANRRSQVRPKKDAELDGFGLLVADTGIPMNILSRFSYAVEIPRDPQLQMKTAMRVIGVKAAATRAAVVESEAAKEEMRLLQIFLALMRERHAQVVISDDIEARVQQLLIDVINMPEQLLQRHDELADFYVRQAEQALLFVAAHARLCNRGVAVAEDVEAVLPMIWRKADFVRTIALGSQCERAVVNAAARARRQVIRHYIDRHWEQSSISVDEVRILTGIFSATRDVLRDDLTALYGGPDEKGRFAVSTVVAVGVAG